MKTKHIIFTIALFFSVAFVNAQDKYEYMIISYFPFYDMTTVSIDGKETIKTLTSGSKDQKMAGTPFLLLVGEYRDKNWEVMSFERSMSDGSFFGYLKRKKAE